MSVDTGRGRVLDVLQPYIDDLTRRNERGARRAAADITIAVLFGLYECREDTDEDLLLVRMGLPGAADDLARIVYAKVKPLHLSLPSLADECPEWRVIQGELKSVLFEPLPRPGRCKRHVPGMTIARDMDTPTLLARRAWFIGGRRYGGGAGGAGD